jgi:hypothetical protein
MKRRRLSLEIEVRFDDPTQTVAPVPSCLGRKLVFTLKLGTRTVSQSGYWTGTNEHLIMISFDGEYRGHCRRNPLGY